MPVRIATPWFTPASLGVSGLLHVGLIGLLVFLSWQSSRLPQRKPPPRSLIMLTDVPSPQPSVAVSKAPERLQATPKPAAVSTPIPAEKPRRSLASPQPSAKPLPRPTPTPTPIPSLDPHIAKLAQLRRLDYFKNWSEADLNNLELPPGVKSWEEFVKLNDQIDKTNWAFLPPELGGSRPPTPIPSGSLTPAPPTWSEREVDGYFELTFEIQPFSGTMTWEVDSQVAQVTAFFPPLPDAPIPEPRIEVFEFEVLEDRMALISALQEHLNLMLLAPSPSPSPLDAVSSPSPTDN